MEAIPTVATSEPAAPGSTASVMEAASRLQHSVWGFSPDGAERANRPPSDGSVASSQSSRAGSRFTEIFAEIRARKAASEGGSVGGDNLTEEEEQDHLRLTREVDELVSDSDSDSESGGKVEVSYSTLLPPAEVSPTSRWHQSRPSGRRWSHAGFNPEAVQAEIDPLIGVVNGPAAGYPFRAATWHGETAVSGRDHYPTSPSDSLGSGPILPLSPDQFSVFIRGVPVRSDAEEEEEEEDEEEDDGEEDGSGCGGDPNSETDAESDSDAECRHRVTSGYPDHVIYNPGAESDADADVDSNLEDDGPEDSEAESEESEPEPEPEDCRGSTVYAFPLPPGWGGGTGMDTTKSMLPNWASGPAISVY